MATRSMRGCASATTPSKTVAWSRGNCGQGSRTGCSAATTVSTRARSGRTGGSRTRSSRRQPWMTRGRRCATCSRSTNKVSRNGTGGAQSCGRSGTGWCGTRASRSGTWGRRRISRRWGARLLMNRRWCGGMRPGPWGGLVAAWGRRAGENRLRRGSPWSRIRGCAKNSGSRSKESDMAELTLLERRRIEAGVLVPIIRAMQAEFGEARVNAVVAGTIRGIARSQGEAERERAQIATVQQLSDRMTNGVLGEGSLIVDVVEQSDTRFGFNVTRCKFKEMYDEMGAGDLGFLLSCNRDFAMFEGLAPDLEFTRTQTRIEGAGYCDFRYRVPAG